MEKRKLVEDFLKDADLMPSYGELKRAMKAHMDYKTLQSIVNQLDKENKILIGEKGILWVYNPSPKLAKAIRAAREL